MSSIQLDSITISVPFMKIFNGDKPNQLKNLCHFHPVSRPKHLLPPNEPMHRNAARPMIADPLGKDRMERDWA